jgi:Methyltransferase domain
MLDNYHLDEFGVLHQTAWKPKVYDKEYLSYYEGLHERTIKLGYQRLGWVLGLYRRLPASVFEIGYGMGTFLEAASLAGVRPCAGYDVARYPLPTGCEFIDWEAALGRAWDLTALFDVLEHLPDLSFLERLRTSALAVAVPYCRWRERGDEWFRTWRMRLPDEHLHHFDPDSLCALLRHHGYRCTDLNTFEDGLRLRAGETGPNILCGFFERVA